MSQCILHAVVKSIGSIPPSLQSCVSAIGDAVVLLRPNLAANDKFIIVYEAIYAIAINLRTDVVPTWHLSASVKSSSPPKPAPPPPAPLLPPTAVGSSNVWQSSPSKVDLTTSNSIASTPNKGPTQKPIQMLPHESRKKSPMNRDNSVELLAQENREKKRKNPEIKPIVFDLPESGQPQHSKRLKLYNATEKSNIASGMEEASFMVPISAASTDSWQQMSPTATAVTTAESRTSIADRLGCKLSSAMIQQSSASAALPDSANMIDGKSQYSDIPANINGLPRSQLPPNGLHREHAPAPKRSTGRNDNALRLFQLSFLDATHRDNPPPRLRIRRTPITAARDPQISTPPANRIVSSETDPLPRILIANVKPTSISNEVSAGGLLQRANLGTATVTMGPRAPTVIFTPNSMSGGTASIASVAAPPERSIVGAWRKQPA
ncbi:hypothetical protein HDU84_002676 [Entophlyctis sp. JEL0112]|nr:hypothetical protein HDU84_002676 [Entophlyctis sp. JEL0112]